MISKALILEASPLFRKFSNVDVPDFLNLALSFKTILNRLRIHSVEFDRYFPNSVKAKSDKEEEHKAQG